MSNLILKAEISRNREVNDPVSVLEAATRARGRGYEDQPPV
jgi:hypothetical protein